MVCVFHRLIFPWRQPLRLSLVNRFSKECPWDQCWGRGGGKEARLVRERNQAAVQAQWQPWLTPWGALELEWPELVRLLYSFISSSQEGMWLWMRCSLQLRQFFKGLRAGASDCSTPSSWGNMSFFEGISGCVPEYLPHCNQFIWEIHKSYVPQD